MRFCFAFRCLVAVLLAMGAGVAVGQTFDLDSGRESVVLLDGKWRFHAGDSPTSDGHFAWASTAFDDTGWQLLDSGKPWSEQGYPDMGGFGWYRFTVRIPAGDKATSLLLAPSVSSYQVFVDGRLVGSRSTMPPATSLPSPEFNYHLFPMTPQGPHPARGVEVALRMWHAPAWANYVGGGPMRPGHIAGDPNLLRSEQQHHELQREVDFVDAYSYSIITALVGIAILCLFFIRPGEREYLWFACMLLAQSADNVLYVGEQIFAWFSEPVYDLLDAALVAFMICVSLRFFSRVLGVPAGKLGRIAFALAVISPPASVFYWPRLATPAASAAVQIACLLPAVLWILFTLVRSAVRGNLDARLLLVPTVLDLGFYFADNLAIVIAQAGWTQVPHIFEVPLPLPPFKLQIGIVLHLIFLLALLVFLIRRFSLARRKEEQMAGELEAAREVQQVLLPDEQDQCPGFHVESIYRPADQVGGDFFQQIADGNGGMLIVVGDVSGKGLPAAMVVSVLVGAIRAEADHDATPASMLASLNNRIMGRAHGGFVTCLAAHLDGDGVLTIANAGHLPPYLNGEEIAAPGSLPLGLMSSAHYEPFTIQLTAGDRLTFVSDGVVEAQGKSGELLGFERTRELSRQSAHAIALAAQEFGQKDDITVVTVEFTGVPCSGDAQTANGSAAGLPATA